MSGFIGLDPSQRTGYAWRSGKGWETGTIERLNPRTLLDVLCKAIADGVTEAVVEDVYYLGNWERSKGLAEAQGRIFSACEQVQLPYVRVDPKEWKSLMLPRVAHERKKQKAASILEAHKQGAKVADDNQADAVMLVVWREWSREIKGVRK